MHFGFENSYDFFKKYDGKDRFKQTTSVLSYFIIKTLCLYNKNSFHSFLHNNLNLFNYNNKENSKLEYNALVIESLQNTSFHEVINKLMNTLKYNVKNKMFLENLRMTCIEMN